MDIIKYHGLSVIRLKVEPQSEVSFVNDQCFIREHSHTKTVRGQALKEIFNKFNQADVKQK